MSLMAYSGNEVGCNSDIMVVGDEVIKTSLHAYGYYDDAQQMVDQVTYYASQLDQQPLRVAPLREIAIVTGFDGYHVRHTYDLIDGPSISALEQADRQTAIAQVLAQLAAMDTIDGPDVLAVPIDGKSQNFHVDAEGPALVDIYPALTRYPDGSFPDDRIGPAHGNIFPWVMGTKSGVLTKMLSSAIYRGMTPVEKVSHIVRKADDWCYDVLPADLDPQVRSAVRHQIATHFIPYLVRVARHRAHIKTGW